MILTSQAFDYCHDCYDCYSEMSASTKNVSPAIKRYADPCPSPVSELRDAIDARCRARLADMFGKQKKEMVDLDMEPPTKVSRSMPPNEEDILDDDEVNKKSDLRSVNVADKVIASEPYLVEFKVDFIDGLTRMMEQRLSDKPMSDEALGALKTVMRAAITGVFKDVQIKLKNEKKLNEQVAKLIKENPSVPKKYLEAIVSLGVVPDQPSAGDVAQHTPHIVRVCQETQVDLSTVNWLFSQYFVYYGAESLDMRLAVANELSNVLEKCERSLPKDADACANARAWFIRHYVNLELVEAEHVRACYAAYLKDI